jgi:hypothetical protein
MEAIHMTHIERFESEKTKLVHVVTEYDRKQEAKRGFNRYALAQYLQALDCVGNDIKAGYNLRDAFVNNFCGRLLDVLLRAVGEPKSTLCEQC